MIFGHKDRMGKLNKAHTATVNRIAIRYEITEIYQGGWDLQTEAMSIEVETSASIAVGITNLLKSDRSLLYIAVTNKEAVPEAIELTEGTRIGVMGPQGDIVKESTPA